MKAAYLLLVAKKLICSGRFSVDDKTIMTAMIEPVLSPAVEVEPIVNHLVQLLSPDFVFEMGKVEEDNGGLPIYHFITALPGTASRTYADCQALVETSCTENGTVQLLCVKTLDLQKHLEQGHLLFSRFCRKSHLLYQNDEMSLPRPAVNILPKLANTAKNHFDQIHHKATAFYEEAVFYLSKGNHSLAVFMLQQAAEHILRGFLQTLTHRNCIGHDLTTLRRRALPLYPELLTLLPVSKDKNDCLLHRFGKAYVHARYDNEFFMPTTEIGQLKEWGENLLVHTKPALMRHIQAFLTTYDRSF